MNQAEPEEKADPAEPDFVNGCQQYLCPLFYLALIPCHKLREQYCRRIFLIDYTKRTPYKSIYRWLISQESENISIKSRSLKKSSKYRSFLKDLL